MATTFRASANGTGNSTAPSATKPTGTVDGDVVVWGVFALVAKTVTPPTGFALVQEQTGPFGGKLSLYQKVAASDGASYGGTLSGTTQWICFAVTFQGTSPGVEQSGSGSNGTAGSPNCVIPAMTTTKANSSICLFQWHESGFGATTWTPDATTTERFDVMDGSATANVCCDTRDVTTAQSYGAWTVVNDVANIGLNNGRYAKLVLSDNSAPVAGMIFPKPSRVAVRRAASW